MYIYIHVCVCMCVCARESVCLLAWLVGWLSVLVCVCVGVVVFAGMSTYVCI